ncbi:MAG: class I SAM-dependent methyltransferase [Gammaproteobacteria bacterium]|nr:class I SAM-dependent methyltransferase [Gammaproteobacteria bacterium]MDH3464989.1 class I SAM-dependent methyltransferase [Gammaproteobacteria bacterium]
MQESLQSNYSKLQPHAIYDEVARKKKAEKTLAVLEDYFSSLDDLCILDVGSGAGKCTRWYAQRTGLVFGIDVDREAVVHAQKNHANENTLFCLADSQASPFADGTFDIVVCSHVYEHVPSAEKLITEIFRILKQGGVCYFAAGNRLSIMEPHYHLPFLSVVPKWAAHYYLRWIGRGDYYYETHRSYWSLKKLVGRFDLLDYSLKIIRQPDKFMATDMLKDGSRKQKLALTVLSTAYWLCPTYVWLLRKP